MYIYFPSPSFPFLHVVLMLLFYNTSDIIIYDTFINATSL